MRWKQAGSVTLHHAHKKNTMDCTHVMQTMLIAWWKELHNWAKLQPKVGAAIKELQDAGSTSP